jgi:hypothetical protein
MNKTSLNAALACLVLAIAPVTLRAELPGKHPAYLHALSDLRHAKAHLERPGGGLQVKWDEKTAIHEIDEAIREIKEASIDDGKNLNDHPPVDAKMDFAGRLHRALELLRKADKDCHEEEDNSFAKGLQKRALHHIHEAIRFTEQGISNAKH